ncbi:PD-(D/E)XK nuclease family protein [Stutzerimonas nitrititolerans]|uniref:PD-(D/E)XK nuclease family protein n=1 Tax=Stutzerimonas nitrititolerans TaxID=2482751 RepID=UPI0028A17680|nr:PD-(D/E)XK nuclease family protein [Stutzerimonas nitrititolerans]
MTVMTCDNLSQLLGAIARLPERPQGEINFFSSGGRGYLENPTSDLMALFMGGNPQVPCWLSKALLHCLAGRGLIETSDLEQVDWRSVAAEREVVYKADQAEASKRLDLLVEGNSFVLGIENKVYAGAASNPFGIYEALLEARSDNRRIFQCVLRPEAKTCDVPPNWPVITYDELATQALALYGTEVAVHPFSKWQVFYSEFLQHLRTLGNPTRSLMDREARTLVLQNFQLLKQAGELLQQFEEEFLKEGVSRVTSALAGDGIDTAVATRSQTWSNGYRALRFFPANWAQTIPEANITLAYFQDMDAVDGSVGLEIFLYLNRALIQERREAIESAFYEAGASDRYTWSCAEKPWEEGGKTSYLGFKVWADSYTREGALQALGEFAQWAQVVVFR